MRDGLSPEELLAAMVGAHALVIRSATKVTAEVLAAGTDLVVVGRAGVGLDNVDVPAATARGVMVVNAPTSNILSAAEQAMALLLAQARNIPQAHAALVAGRVGAVEVGGGRAARQGAGHGRAGPGRRPGGPAGAGLRHAAAGLRPLRLGRAGPGHGRRAARPRGAVRRVRLHHHPPPKTPETAGLVGRDLLAKAKPGIRIVNTARGGIIDEDALAEAIRDGLVAGAGLDVFANEPTTESPLFELARSWWSPRISGPRPRRPRTRPG